MGSRSGSTARAVTRQADGHPRRVDPALVATGLGLLAAAATVVHLAGQGPTPVPPGGATGTPVAIAPMTPGPTEGLDGVATQQDLDDAAAPGAPTSPDSAMGAPAAPPTADVPADEVADPAGLTSADRAAGLLSALVPVSAGGELVVVPGAEPAPVPDRPTRTVRVEVEAGLDVDGPAFARTVMGILNDPRGWGADGSVSFARTDGDADLRVVLGSPAMVDSLCAPLETVGKYSCGRNGHAALNHTRWVQATEEFTDREQYRHYLVNHEVGHLLGRPHVPCPAPGAVAPIMQQQTIAVAPCTANGWPFPDAR